MDWNPNESEADGCYPVWSLSLPLSRAQKSLIHALIFRQDWFYSDINDVQFCGSFNHRHPSNIQQKTPSSATNTVLKCCSLQGVQPWIHLQVTLICAQIQWLTSWQWNIRESAETILRHSLSENSNHLSWQWSPCTWLRVPNDPGSSAISALPILKATFNYLPCIALLLGFELDAI